MRPSLSRLGLRVLRVRIPGLSGQTVQALVESLPQEMVAVHLSTAVWEKPLVSYRRLGHK